MTRSRSLKKIFINSKSWLLGSAKNRNACSIIVTLMQIMHTINNHKLTYNNTTISLKIRSVSTKTWIQWIYSHNSRHNKKTYLRNLYHWWGRRMKTQMLGKLQQLLLKKTNSRVKRISQYLLLSSTKNTKLTNPQKKIQVLLPFQINPLLLTLVNNPSP